MATAALVAGCASRRPGEVADDGSVTVRHVFGETRIPGPPHRVVSAGLTGQDDLLAVGVVPIAVTDWFGGEPYGVWPWAAPKLGGAEPVVLSLADGIAVNEIRALTPDLIVATNAGLDRETYNALSQIAPTVAQSGSYAFFEPWQQQATTIGQAVFKHDEMQRLITDVEQRFTDVADAHPEFAGKRVLLAEGRLEHDGVRPASPAWRTDFLTRMGFAVADAEGPIGRDRLGAVLDGVDVAVWTTESDEERAALLADPEIAKLGERNVFTDKELAGAIAFASPLSYPVVADRLPGLIAAALA